MFRTLITALVLCTGAHAALAQPAQDPIQHLLANFDRIDADGDGVVSAAEYRSVQTARWPQIDRNGDGYLGEDDFPPLAARRARTQLAEIAHLDTSGDGRIGRDEFLEGPAPLFRRADQDGDGALTRAEVQSAAP